MSARRFARTVRGSRSGAGEPGLDDVLFGTMGLTTILLLWALTQIGVPDVSRAKLEELEGQLAAAQQARSEAEDAADRERAARAKAERELESERRRRERSEQQLAQAEADLREAEEARRRAESAQAQAEREKNALEPKPCDLVLTPDTTASQADAIASLRNAAMAVSEIGARLSPRFRVGIVAYNGDGFVTLPLTEVGATVNGTPSAGMQKLQAFLDDLETVSGAADVEGAIKKGLGMLDRARLAGSRQLLVLAGDVACWEGGEIDVIEPSDRESARRSVGFIRDFAARGDQHRVLALFTGKHSSSANKAESIAFFQNVAQAAGDRGTYSDEVSQLSATLVEALFGQ